MPRGRRWTATPTAPSPTGPPQRPRPSRSSVRDAIPAQVRESSRLSLETARWFIRYRLEQNTTEPRCQLPGFAQPPARAHQDGAVMSRVTRRRHPFGMQSLVPNGGVAPSYPKVTAESVPYLLRCRFLSFLRAVSRVDQFAGRARTGRGTRSSSGLVAGAGERRSSRAPHPPATAMLTMAATVLARSDAVKDAEIPGPRVRFGVRMTPCMQHGQTQCGPLSSTSMVC